jgi:Flp pilus assembly protein TadG
MIAPVMAVLMVGVAEVSNTLRLKHRLDSASQQIGQVVSQCNVISEADTGQFWAEAAGLLEGATSLEKGEAAIIVSAVYRDGTTDKVAWQIRTGSSAFASAIGAAGGAATLPGTFSPPGEHIVIATEVFSHVRTLVVDPKVAAKVAEAINLPDRVSATTFSISRALDPAALRQIPTDTDSKMFRKCTA